MSYLGCICRHMYNILRVYRHNHYPIYRLLQLYPLLGCNYITAVSLRLGYSVGKKKICHIDGLPETGLGKMKQLSIL